jgi:hypothetical protein
MKSGFAAPHMVATSVGQSLKSVGITVNIPRFVRKARCRGKYLEIATDGPIRLFTTRMVSEPTPSDSQLQLTTTLKTPQESGTIPT